MESDLKKKHKKQKHQHPNQTTPTQTPAAKNTSDFSFKPCSEVKGLRFGGQIIIKSFTIRRAAQSDLLRLLSLHQPRLSSTAAFIPTNFTVLAHRAWHTLTLGLGTKKSKVVIFVFESEKLKASIERLYPPVIPLGDVNKKLIRGAIGCELARFKFRKGCITFYVYAVRKIGDLGFSSGDELRTVLQSVVELKDFVDHTAMLALPNQRSIGQAPPIAAVH